MLCAVIVGALGIGVNVCKGHDAEVVRIISCRPTSHDQICHLGGTSIDENLRTQLMKRVIDIWMLSNQRYMRSNCQFLANLNQNREQCNASHIR